MSKPKKVNGSDEVPNAIKGKFSYKKLIEDSLPPSFTGEQIERLYDELGLEAEELYDVDEYITHEETEDVSFIEVAIINDYLYNAYRGKHKDVKVISYGEVDNVGRLSYGGVFTITGNFWFTTKIKGDDNEYIFQTKTALDSRGELINQLHMTSKVGINSEDFEELFKKIKKLSFNNSQYKGKCIKVKLRESRFRGIEIIDIPKNENELILNETQVRWIKHFVNRLKRGGNARYLFNGKPGSGKTNVIRDITRILTPKITFIIPDFSNSDDLTSILEACEIFDNGVIIMDDIDLYLGSREKGSYTRLLGEFLSFFDGVQKRNISLLASTNDKGLVDMAASRPGRFNSLIDFGCLDDEQIVKVCNVHLEKKWQVKEVHDVLMGRIDGKKVEITGAFIANLASNIREMSIGDKNWKLKDTITLIEECYRGFYHSQISKANDGMGFKI